MKFCPDRPMIVRGDGVVLLEADHPAFAEVRDRLTNLAELVKTPDHLHTYRITPLSLWNAVSAGWSVQEAVGFLEEESKFGLPASLKRQVEEKMGRCGLVTLTSKEKQLILSVADAALSQKMRKSRP